MRIVPGTGKWTINGRDARDYFPNKVHQQDVNEPFKVLELDGAYDVIARIHGGGASGQAGALRLGVARALNEVDAEQNRPTLKKAGFLTRDARVIGAQEGRSEEGPQGSAVHQALIAALRERPPWRPGRLGRTVPPLRRSAAARVRPPRSAPPTRAVARDGSRTIERHTRGTTLRHRRRPRARQRRPHRRAGARPLGRGRARAGRDGRLRRPPPVAVVGRDPRASGEFLSAAVDGRAGQLPASTSATPACCPRRPSPS